MQFVREIVEFVAYPVSWDTLWSVTPLFTGFHPWYLLFWVNVSLLYRALFPKRHTSPLNPGLYSEGLQMWLLLKNDPALLEETHKAYFVMQVADELAYFIAVVGDPARLPEAETLSREALAACPGVGAFLGTRGAVLVRLTKNEEGLEFLRKSLKDSPDSESQGENLTWMALAHFQLGQREKAGELLRRASKHGPTFPLFEEVSKLLAPPPCRT